MIAKPTVYIETTVVSYLTARPSRDLVQAAQQQITREWWDLQRPRFNIYTGEMVIVEASAGDAEAATQRLAVLRGLPLLKTTEEALDLANALLGESALPPTAERDALHVAVAALHGMDFLLTWNCRHLANAILRDRIEQVCEKAGFGPPKICTPEELSGEELSYG
jgi:predicted nucleic acid-binding protein